VSKSAPILLLVSMLIVSSIRAVDAQGLGYGIAGPAGVSGFFRSSLSAVHVAGGGEALVDGRSGVGGECGVLAGSGSALLAVSVNGVHHVVRARTRGLSPFITGGYTFMGAGYGEGSFSAWNLGAGVDVWAKDRVGVRIDFRDHVRPDSRGTVQYWTVRAGVVFR